LRKSFFLLVKERTAFAGYRLPQQETTHNAFATAPLENSRKSSATNQLIANVSYQNQLRQW